MLRNFLAVMKDSFREAVDGFIIYVMLGMAVLTILLAVSFSFEPESADAAFPVIVGRFSQAFRNRGTETEEVGTRIKVGPFTGRVPIPFNYSATDVQKLDADKGYAGKYKMRVTVKSAGGKQGQTTRGGAQGVPSLDVEEQDVEVVFRTVVYCWSKPNVPEQHMLIQARGATATEGEPVRVELLPDGVDPEQELATREKSGGRWQLFAVPRPLALDTNRKSLAILGDMIKRGDAGGVLFEWLKADFRRQEGINVNAGGPKPGKDEVDRAKLPDFLTRGLWALVKREGKSGDLESLTREDLGKIIDTELARLDDELKATVGAVTDQDMEDFIRNQFLVHGDIENVKVSRRADPASRKGGATELQFDVEAEVKSGAKGWPYRTKFMFGAFGGGTAEPFGRAIYGVQDNLVNTVGASITLLVAVILTGFFIPNLLRKGSLDLIMAKPMARWELLLYKYLGGLTFMLLVTGITVTGVWLALAIRSGNWNPTFLLSIVFITFIFAVLYAVSTLIAVLTRSAIAAILITSIFMVFMGVMGLAKTGVDAVRVATEKEEDKKWWLYTAIDVTNDVLPRYNDVMKLNSLALKDAYLTPAESKEARQIAPPSWFASVGISMVYIVGLLALAYLRFATRDP